MFPSKVCQLLCNLHAISIETPTGPVVTQCEKPKISVDRITAHIQHRDEFIHWRVSLIGQGTLYLVLPEDGLYNLHICIIWSCTVENLLYKRIRQKGESCMCNFIYFIIILSSYWLDKTSTQFLLFPPNDTLQSAHAPGTGNRVPDGD